MHFLLHAFCELVNNLRGTDNSNTGSRGITNTATAAMVLIPYFLFGLLLKTALTSSEGWRSGFAVAAILIGIALGIFWLSAIFRAFRYRKCLGMDTGFWLIGIPLTIGVAAGISFFVSHIRWQNLTP